MDRTLHLSCAIAIGMALGACSGGSPTGPTAAPTPRPPMFPEYFYYPKGSNQPIMLIDDVPDGGVSIGFLERFLSELPVSHVLGLQTLRFSSYVDEIALHVYNNLSGASKAEWETLAPSDVLPTESFRQNYWRWVSTAIEVWMDLGTRTVFPGNVRLFLADLVAGERMKASQFLFMGAQFVDVATREIIGYGQAHAEGFPSANPRRVPYSLAGNTLTISAAQLTVQGGNRDLRIVRIVNFFGGADVQALPVPTEFLEKTFLIPAAAGWDGMTVLKWWDPTRPPSSFPYASGKHTIAAH